MYIIIKDMDKETIVQLLADGVISNEAAAKYFPELKESEDWWIRKEILDYIVKATGCKRWIDWLKKQGEQKLCMIQWKGDNLKEVIKFTGKDKNFDKWFKSFEEYEKYVHEHNDIFKLFNKNGSHYEVPVGAWIVKTPDGYNVASKAVLRQKPTDKVEPKFKVGDIIRHKKQGFTCKITSVDTEYSVSDCCGTHLPFDWQDAYELVEQKPAWSKEDETILGEIIDFFENGTVKLQHDLSLYAFWLKSLKDRYTWKPSDEQMQELGVVATGKGLFSKEILRGLLEQLKKLREE